MRPVLLALLSCLPLSTTAAQARADEQRVVIASDGWQLVGDLRLPAGSEPVPAVLLLNEAAGTRQGYERLARHLADRGVASLRLDLRGHGESTNLGRFVPGQPRDPLIWDAERDVMAAHRFLRRHARIAPERIGIVGASYSGEEMAEAGRASGYAAAYVALSPGSFSDTSIVSIDESGVPWLFVVSRDERFLREITADVQEHSSQVHLEILPGTAHAMDLLDAHPALAERIAVWLAETLGGAR